MDPAAGIGLSCLLLGGLLGFVLGRANRQRHERLAALADFHRRQRQRHDDYVTGLMGGRASRRPVTAAELSELWREA